MQLGTSPLRSIFLFLGLMERAAFLVLAASPLGVAQWRPAPASVIPLKVITEGDLAKFWRVGRADLVENFEETRGHVELENLSAKPVPEAALYAEYFDAAGRLCFTMVFSQEQNMQMREGPLQPGEARTLTCAITSLGPAVQPVEAKFYLAWKSQVGRYTRYTTGQTPVCAPATVGGGFTPRFMSLQIGPELMGSNSALVDLLLARIEVSARGRMEHAEVLHAANEGIRVWFEELGRQLLFFPASSDAVREKSSTLVLARAISFTDQFWDKPLILREDPWVKSYIGTRQEDEIPLVNQFLFMPSPTRESCDGREVRLPLAPLGYFRLINTQTSWCDLVSYRSVE